MRAVVVSGLIASALALAACTGNGAPEPSSTATGLDGRVVDVTSPEDVYPGALRLSAVGAAGEIVVSFTSPDASGVARTLDDRHGVALVEHDGSTTVLIPDGTYPDDGADITPYAQVSVSTVLMIERALDGSGTFLFYDRRAGTLTRVPGIQQVPNIGAVDLTHRAWRGVLKNDRLYVAVDGDAGGAAIAEITPDGRVRYPLGDAYLGNDVELGVDVCNGDLVAWSASIVGTVSNRALFRFTMEGGRPTGIDDATRTRRYIKRDGYRFQRGIVRACGDRWLARADGDGSGRVGTDGGEIATSGPLATDTDVPFGNATAYELGWNGTWATISVYTETGAKYWEDEKSALFNTDTGEYYVVEGATDGCSGISQSGEWIAWEETVGPPSADVLARPRSKCVTYVGRLAPAA